MRVGATSSRLKEFDTANRIIEIGIKYLIADERY